MSSDVTSEESSVREGAGYNETFGSGDESEDFSPSLERERERDVGKEGSGSDGDDDGDEEDGDSDEEDKESCEGTSVGPRDNCSFILPKKWAVNRFLPLMSDKVFKVLRT